jgi:hypothetical protein
LFWLYSLAWAEIYLIIAALIQRFEFKFQDIVAADFEMETDQFIIGIKAGAVLKARATAFKA